jgi:hypothetical protein
MKIIQKQLVGKNNKPEICEDAIFENENFVAVLDGTTTKTSLDLSKSPWNEKTPGKMAIDLLLAKLKEFPKYIKHEDAFALLDEEIGSWYRANDLYQHMEQNPVDRCSVDIIIYNKHFHQLWTLGDYQVFIDNELKKYRKPVDKINNEARSLFIEAELAKGKTIDELRQKDSGRDYILPMLKNQYLFQNNPDHNQYSYFVLDGFLTNLEQVKVLSLPENTQYLVMATDGYPKLFPSLEESEKALETILKEDPLCFREFKSTKGLQKDNISFDDRAFVKIGFDE